MVPMFYGFVKMHSLYPYIVPESAPVMDLDRTIILHTQWSCHVRVLVYIDRVV